MDNKPRILYILHSPIVVNCGTELHTKSLFEGLADNYDTWVVFPHGDELYLSQDGENFRLFTADQLSQQMPPLYSHNTDQSIKAILNDIKPDIIHIQHFVNWPLSMIELVSNTGIPVLITLHDNYAITPEYTLANADPKSTLTADYAIKTFGEDISGYLKKRREIVSSCMIKADRRIVPSDYLARIMASVFPLKYDVIQHGIPEFISPLREHNDRSPVFGYIGKFLPIKGWDTLVQVFTSLRLHNPDIELHLYGGKPSQRDSLTCPGVNYHGMYDQNSLAKILSRIDVVVIPSVVAESFSLVLSEAWMAGIPVISADIGALDDRVIDGVNGKKFKAGDADSLRQVMAWFINNNSWKKWIIDKPVARNEMLSDYDGIYEDVLSGS